MRLRLDISRLFEQCHEPPNGSLRHTQEFRDVVCIPVVDYRQPNDPPPKIDRIWSRHFKLATTFFKFTGLTGPYCLNYHACACVEWDSNFLDNQPENLSS